VDAWRLVKYLILGAFHLAEVLKVPLHENRSVDAKCGRLWGSAAGRADEISFGVQCAVERALGEVGSGMLEDSWARQIAVRTSRPAPGQRGAARPMRSRPHR
jgi:hypothetical protein